MNIGFDAKRLFNNNTGLGNYSRTLVNNLSLHYPNHQYHLYTPKISAQYLNWNKNSNVKMHIAPQKLLKNYWRTFQLTSELENDNINIYHGLSHELPSNIAKSNIKSVVTIHDLIFKIYPNTYPVIDRWIYDKKFRYSCENSDKIIAISECTKNDIIKYYKIDSKKIDVLYQSCNSLFFEPPTIKLDQIQKEYNLPSEYILYVGSITERKNILNLLKAYSMLPNKLQIPLIIVGNGSRYKDKCQDLSIQLEIESNIIWINNLHDNHYLQALYQNAMCFIYPSLYEGFGIPIIEALLSKTLVATSNTSCMPEAGGKDSFYFDPEKPEEISNQIQSILELSEFEKQHRINSGFLFAQENFNAKITTEKLYKLYTRL